MEDRKKKKKKEKEKTPLKFCGCASSAQRIQMILPTLPEGRNSQHARSMSATRHGSIRQKMKAE